MKGERAHSLSLRLPIVLGVIALSFPVPVRRRAAPRSPLHPRTTHERKKWHGGCKANVTVKFFEQVGARGGGDDLRTGISDTTALQGGRWTYSFGNPGLDDGRYYAKVKGTDRCKPGFSPTIRVDRN